MPKKRVYVESSVISYLTARPAKKPIPRLRQLATAAWWEQRQRWELFVSDTVIREIRAGDPEAAFNRVKKIVGLPILSESDEARRLADSLVAANVVPEKALDDARHVAVATICGMDYLATWNMRHLSNPERIVGLYAAIREKGCKPSILVRPDELLEMDDDK